MNNKTKIHQSTKNTASEKDHNKKYYRTWYDKK